MRKYNIDGHIMIAKVDDNSVFFNSKFETANLSQVFRVPGESSSPSKPLEKPETPNSHSTKHQDQRNLTVTAEFNLYLQEDTNSDNSLTQWFYFSCFNIKKGTVMKLNMLNLMKDDSLYSQGMRPFVYSRRRHIEGDGVQWHREGFNIDYFYNDKTIKTTSKTLDMEFDSRYVDNQKDKFKKTNTLTFCYEFKYDNDMVFFTHFAPYSYSDVFRYLCKLEVNPRLREFMRIDYICQSLGKVPMYGVTITHDIENDYLTQE